MLSLPFKAKRHSRPSAADPNHRPELDGIRGIALLAVMLSHGGPYIARTTMLSKLFAYAMIPGWSGVELFFVLSGFLITGILLKSKTAENYLSSFYARRFLRIFPIYYLVLTVGLLAAIHVSWWNALLPAAGKTRLAYYFYAQNWPMFWPHHLFLRTNGFGHFWSLAVEEQFYIVWPLVIWLLPENAILGLCTAGLVVALPLRVFMVHKFSYHFTAMALTTSRVDGLLVGVILAILLRRGQIPLRWIYLCMSVGAGIIGFIAVFHHTELIATYFYMPTIGITGFSLLSGGLLAMSQQRIVWLGRILKAQWLRTVGKYSYGMYIYHIPAYLTCDHYLGARFGMALPMPLRWALLYVGFLIAVTFLVAKVSYDLFEAKILALKVYFRPRYEKSAKAHHETSERQEFEPNHGERIGAQFSLP
ncbi:MAG TPA: acyltransferase [Acidobacteriaceae bacterium]|nr:acyltransferase [Acidobacteriaceae bacterium]